MNCAHAEALLDEYVDCELSRRCELDLQTHLRDCARCRAALARLRNLSGAIRATGAVSVVPGFRERLMERIDAGAKPGWRRRDTAPLAMFLDETMPTDALDEFLRATSNAA